MFEEAEANKAAGKYDNVSIDYQIEFYKNEGLTPYSEAKLPITSGKCVILMCIVCVTLYLEIEVFGFMSELLQMFLKVAWL